VPVHEHHRRLEQRDVERRRADLGKLPVEHRDHAVVVDHQVPDAVVAVAERALLALRHVTVEPVLGVREQRVIAERRAPPRRAPAGEFAAGRLLARIDGGGQHGDVDGVDGGQLAGHRVQEPRVGARAGEELAPFGPPRVGHPALRELRDDERQAEDLGVVGMPQRTRRLDGGAVERAQQLELAGQLDDALQRPGLALLGHHDVERPPTAAELHAEHVRGAPAPQHAPPTHLEVLAGVAQVALEAPDDRLGLSDHRASRGRRGALRRTRACRRAGPRPSPRT
jgi:hypothetical protein